MNLYFSFTKALKEYGFTVCPLSLVDEVGVEVAASVAKNLKERTVS